MIVYDLCNHWKLRQVSLALSAAGVGGLEVLRLPIRKLSVFHEAQRLGSGRLEEQRLLKWSRSINHGFPLAADALYVDENLAHG